MELIRISDRKMKIMLTSADMTFYELNEEKLNGNGQKIHRSFHLLLEDIRKKTGFALDDRQITVQYFPSREGGCEMFVSGFPSEPAEKKAAPAKGQKQGLLPSAQAHEKVFRRESVYRFSSLDDVLHVCRRLLSFGYRESASAYADDSNHYYLLLEISGNTPFAQPEELYFITEYGWMENTAAWKHYISEHGKAICKGDAIPSLGELI